MTGFDDLKGPFQPKQFYRNRSTSKQVLSQVQRASVFLTLFSEEVTIPSPQSEISLAGKEPGGNLVFLGFSCQTDQRTSKLDNGTLKFYLELKDNNPIYPVSEQIHYASHSI